MTDKQRIKLMSIWWPDACAAAGWNPNDREKRIEVLSDAVQRPLKSANDLNDTTDIDQVKAHLLAISQPDNLNAQLQQQDMPRTRLIRSIYQFGLHPNYLGVILKRRFKTDRVENLSLHHLEQLRNTLAARLNSKAKKARAVQAQSDLVPF
jgi:hypothetical protein